MESNYDFNFVLSDILNVLNISNNKLAKAINVDPSLVSRWKTGKRKIPLDSNYLRLTSNYLSENVFSHSQKENLLKIANKYNITITTDISIDTKKFIYELLLSALQNSNTYETIAIDTAPIQKNETNTPRYLCNIELIKGHKNVINAGLELLKSLPKKPGSIDQPILITFLTERDSFSNYNETFADWNNTLLEVQQKGWKLQKLLKINDNNTRNLSIVHEMLNNINSENYHLHYLTKYDIVLNYRELIVVPTIGVLVCLCSRSNSHIDSAFLIKDEEAMNIFNCNFHQHFVHSIPLVNNNHNIKLLDLLSQFADFEDEATSSFAFNSCLNYTRLPLEIHEPLTASNSEVIKLHKDIKKAFITKLEQFDFYEILSKKYIKNIIKLGKSSDSILTPSYIIEAFENMISLLEKYDNYHIALLNENSTSRVFEEFTWNIKGGNSVLIGKLSKTNKDGNKPCIAITEPNIVNTFSKDFIVLWESIPPINKNKAEVILWLKAQIKSLKEA